MSRSAGTGHEPRVQTVLLADSADVTALKLLAVNRTTTVSHLIEGALERLLSAPGRRRAPDGRPGRGVRLCITLPPTVHHALRLYAVKEGVSQRVVLDQVVHELLTSPVPKAQVVAIANPRRGSGKTLTSAVLAQVLHRGHHRRVLVVDLDPAGEVTRHLGGAAPADGSAVTDILLAEHPDAWAPRSAIRALPADRPAVLAGGARLAWAEVRLTLAASHEALRRLARAIDAVAADYDIVLLDCPPNLGPLTLSALVAADWLLVPAVPRDGWGVAQIAAAAEEIRLQCLNRHLAVLSVVWTQVPDGDRPHADVAALLPAALEPRLRDAPVIRWSSAAPIWLDQIDVPAGYEAVAAALVAAGQASAERVAAAGENHEQANHDPER